ncbi:MAG: CysB family HTH-type transcriptional regulator [Thiohalomonadales bacterium]
MKLHQLRYAIEIADNNYNVSEAADGMFTSQPGVSKQVRLLEDELGVPIFARDGKRLVGLTTPGRKILHRARQVFREIDNITRIGQQYANADIGSFTIATSHTQARYVLPSVIQRFLQRYPKVNLIIKQGYPEEIVNLVVDGKADIAIATEGVINRNELISLPSYQWHRCLLVPKKHELLRKFTAKKRKKIQLEDISNYPIITYDVAFAGQEEVLKVFEQAGINPNIVITALDSDVIKTYVEMNLGIGLIANTAFEPDKDKAFGLIDVSHLFKPNTTWIGVSRGGFVRNYVYDFIEMFAPHLKKKSIMASLNAE